jgi:hypothetical protein
MHDCGVCDGVVVTQYDNTAPERMVVSIKDYVVLFYRYSSSDVSV